METAEAEDKHHTYMPCGAEGKEALPLPSLQAHPSGQEQRACFPIDSVVVAEGLVQCPPGWQCVIGLPAIPSSWHLPVSATLPSVTSHRSDLTSDHYFIV